MLHLQEAIPTLDLALAPPPRLPLGETGREAVAVAVEEEETAAPAPTVAVVAVVAVVQVELELMAVGPPSLVPAEAVGGLQVGCPSSFVTPTLTPILLLIITLRAGDR